MIKACFLFFFLWPLNSFAGDWDYRTEFFFEPRFYRSDENSLTKDSQQTLSNRSEISYDHHNRSFIEHLQFFAMADGVDSERTVFYLEEANVTYSKGKHSAGIGAYTFDWSVLDNFHPADVINPRYLDGNLRNLPKIGEFALFYKHSFNSQRGLSVLIMPLLTPEIFPNPSSRMSLSSSEIKDPLWQKGSDLLENKSELQWAILWQDSWKELDYTAHIVQHFDKNHSQIVTFNGELRPIYFWNTQIGGTAQWTLEKWIFKSELVYEQFEGLQQTAAGAIKQLDHSVVALGLEYQWAFKKGPTLDIIFELQSLLGVSEEEAFNLNIFQRDFYLGLRYSLNDRDQQEIIASVLTDLVRDNEQWITISYKRKFLQTWGFQFGFNLIEAFRDDPTPNGLQLYGRNNEMSLKISKFF